MDERKKLNYSYSKAIIDMVKKKHPDYKENIDDFPILLNSHTDDLMMIDYSLGGIIEIFEKFYNSNKLFSRENITSSSNIIGFDVWVTFKWSQIVVKTI